MVKLIMTDIDGTLIPDGTMDINPEYFEVIEKLVEKGIIFVVASGRHMSSVKKVFAPVLDKIWVASQNGNVLTYHGKSRIIKSIPQEWGREMWRQFSKLKGVEGVLDTATEMYCPFEETSMYKILADEYHFNVTGTGGWNQVPEEDFSMMTLYHPQSAENICKELVEDKWKGKLEFLTSGKYWVDIVMPEVGKGTALEEICSQLGIAPEETIAFGDNLNDISMIQSAGKGYAVNTAREETKKAAKKATTRRSKKDMKVNAYVEYYGKQVHENTMIADVKKAWTKSGHKIGEIKTMDLYIKPDESKVYYVINETESGSVEF